MDYQLNFALNLETEKISVWALCGAFNFGNNFSVFSEKWFGELPPKSKFSLKHGSYWEKIRINKVDNHYEFCSCSCDNYGNHIGRISTEIVDENFLDETESVTQTYPHDSEMIKNHLLIKSGYQILN